MRLLYKVYFQGRRGVLETYGLLPVPLFVEHEKMKLFTCKDRVVEFGIFIVMFTQLEPRPHFTESSYFWTRKYETFCEPFLPVQYSS